MLTRGCDTDSLHLGRNTMSESETAKSYQSLSGFKMWGGTERPPGRPLPLRWVSAGIVVGIALAVGACLAQVH